MKKSFKLLSLFMVLAVVFVFAATPVSAASTITRNWDDWESYSETDDILYLLGTHKRQYAITSLELDTTSKLSGKNCVKVTYDCNLTPGYGVMFHEPPGDNRGLKNLISTTDGFKIKMAAPKDMYVRLRLSFAWADYQNDIWLKIGPTPKIYTVRWQDGWEPYMLKAIEECNEFCRLEFVAYSHYDPEAFKNQNVCDLEFNNPISGEFYFDDFSFFKGDDKTDEKDDVGYLGVEYGKAAITSKPNTSDKNNGTSSKPTTSTPEESEPDTSIDTEEPDTSVDIKDDETPSEDNESKPQQNDEGKDNDSSKAWIWIVIGAVALIGVSAGTFFVIKAKKGSKK